MRFVLAATLLALCCFVGSAAFAFEEPTCYRDESILGVLKPESCLPVEGAIAKKQSGPPPCYDGRFSPEGLYRQRDGVPRPHKGIDLLAPVDTPVRAAKSGTILGVRDWKDRPLGKEVFVEHEDGSVSRYAHLSSFEPAALLLSINQQNPTTASGQLIGYVGTTGNAEGLCPHLHLQIHANAFSPQSDGDYYTFSLLVLDPIAWIALLEP